MTAGVGGTRAAGDGGGGCCTGSGVVSGGIAGGCSTVKVISCVAAGETPLAA
jgi:hypothetical protein